MAAATTSLQVDRLLVALYGPDACAQHFGGLHALDAQQLGRVRDLLLRRLAGDYDPDGLKQEMQHEIQATLDEGFHDPLVLMQWLVNDLASA